MERVIVCPVCKDSDTCFEEIQENFSSYMCFNCGFMSDTRYRAGSVELLDNLNQSPQLVQDLQYNDCLLYTSPSPRDVEESRIAWCG